MEENQRALYNFLDCKLSPKITTQAAAMDNYEAQNLVNENPLIRSRGFLAYTSIKPPIDIDFELICAVNIHYISVCTTVGTQKTIGIELLAKNNNGTFQSIGQSFYNQSGVVFYNSRYYSKGKLPGNVNTTYSLNYFKNYTFRSYTNATAVRLRILRTERSVPCLGQVEIWGNVSKTCSTITCDTIKRIMFKKLECSSNGMVNSLCATKKRDFEVPEDFKDALTYEIMAIPMTLPSGHTIDQTTIAKCVENDACYGRQAGDPFTGLPFTDKRKPILNTALKTRIDMFLIENAHRSETFHLPRTTGRKFKLSNEWTVTSSKKLNLGDDRPKDLDDAIAQVINNQNFVSFTRDAPKQSKKLCAKCNSSDNLYSISCPHLHCRKCLLGLVGVCNECGKLFSKRDVLKLNL